MEGISLERIQQCAREKYPRTHDKIINYGTSGFRTRADDLDHILYRMGVLAVLRSKITNATIGAMITASHNPEEDNGVKLVDPMGEMLETAFEKNATYLANVKDEDVSVAVKKIVDQEKINTSASANVVFARDTRPSSKRLAEALQCGVEAAGGSFKDYGLLTTPQLHYMVRCINTNSQYGTATEEGYYQKITKAFCDLHKRVCEGSYTSDLVVDAANGIGALQMKPLYDSINKQLQIKLFNDGTTGRLNFECGADYVKLQQKPPKGIDMTSGNRYASFDGDADRIVYFYCDDEKIFHLMDGDKIAILVAGYLQDLVKKSGLTLDLGLVQTAYANGSSTQYITEKLKVPVACVPTGVKYLHHRAQQFEIGVYFEANGHGTVIFNDSVKNKIKSAVDGSSLSEEQRKAVSQLSSLINLINETVGDAISDMLLAEVILSARGWGIKDWDKAYTDLPNRQLKVKVKDRNVIETADAERKAVKPDGLQSAVDQLVSTYRNGRSFVRPSGTEDVVRVYAEADTQENADKLAHEVGLKVYELAGGVGDIPKPPQ